MGRGVSAKRFTMMVILSFLEPTQAIASIGLHTEHYDTVETAHVSASKTQGLAIDQ